MRLRVSFSAAILALTTACAPQIPNSAAVGTASPQSVEARDAMLAGVPVGSAPLDSLALDPDSAEATAAETTRILAQTSGQAQPVTVAPISTVTVTNTNGISDENNFDAVSGQRTIEGDAARIAQNKAQYQVIEPQALPERAGGEQPNIVAFALATSHPVGASVYARAGLGGTARAERNCAGFTSPDQAQIEFLSRGGPKRDSLGIDPDGDGYACRWDPSPFRKAAQG